MNTKMLVTGIGALIIIAAAAFLLTKNSTSNVTPTDVPTPTAAMMEETPTASPSSMEVEEDSSGAVVEGAVKEITVTGSSFKFAPATISVNKGDKVKLIFKSQGGMHNFVIDELGVETEILSSGDDQTVEFVATKVGTFDYYCSVGNHRAMGMVGKITVK